MDYVFSSQICLGKTDKYIDFLIYIKAILLHDEEWLLLLCAYKYMGLDKEILFPYHDRKKRFLILLCAPILSKKSARFCVVIIYCLSFQ